MPTLRKPCEHVDPEDKQSVSLGLTGRASILVNEAGLYSLILRGHTEAAKKFKRWLTSEVLPAIRKRGVYMTDAVAKLAEAQPTSRGSVGTLIRWSYA